MSNRSEGLMLMVTALFIVAVPGIIVNNMQNSGLLAPTQTSCPAGQTLVAGQCMACNNSTNTCYLVANVGCNTTGSNPLGNCALQGSSLSLLNACSPFTNILTLNFIGFVQSFFSNCGTPGSSGTQPPNVIKNTTTLTIVNIVCVGPSPVEFDGTNGCTGWLAQWPSSGAFQITCSSTATTFRTNGNVCLVHPATFNNDVCGAFGIVPASPFFCMGPTFVEPQLLVGSYIHVGDTGYIINGTALLTCQTDQIACQAVVSGGGLSVNSILTFFLACIGGILLLLLGLGINIGIGGSILATGASTSLGSNPQGTKLAQVFGIGLIIWSPIYSEFSIWFTSGFLPFGLDGSIGLISIGVIALFFFGAWKFSQSPVGAST